MKEGDTKGTKVRQKFQGINDGAVGTRGKYNRETRVWGKKIEKKKNYMMPKDPTALQHSGRYEYTHEEGSPWPPAWKEAQESQWQWLFFTLGIAGLSICLNKNYRVEKDAIKQTFLQPELTNRHYQNKSRFRNFIRKEQPRVEIVKKRNSGFKHILRIFSFEREKKEKKMRDCLREKYPWSTP